MYTKNILISAGVVLALLLLTTAWTVFAGGAAAPGDTYEKNIIYGEGLEWSAAGPWIVSVQTPAGPIVMYQMQYPLDAAGKRYTGFLWEVNDSPTNFGLFPEAEQGQMWITTTVRTGPDTFESTNLSHQTKKGSGVVHETVTFVVVNAKWRVTGPNSNEGDATMAVYLASQDADSNGLPDEGQEPAVCMPFSFKCTRLTVMPGCVPTPMQ